MLKTNDPDQPTAVLTLKGTLREAIEVTPSDEVILTLEPGKGAEQVATVHSFEPAPLRILKVSSSVPYVKAELLPGEPPPDPLMQSRSRRAIRIQVLPGAPATTFTAVVAIDTNSAKRPRVLLNVMNLPEGAVRAYPPRIYFDSLPVHPSEPVMRSIMLIKMGGDIKLLKAEVRGPALRLEITQEPHGQFAQVAVRYTGGWKPGPVSGTLVLQTSDPLRPRVEVPFSAQVVP
jgi:hypothetical protein